MMIADKTFIARVFRHVVPRGAVLVKSWQHNSSRPRFRGIHFVLCIQQNFLDRQTNVGMIFDKQNSWHWTDRF